jgi:hypothetical protein
MAAPSQPPAFNRYYSPMKQLLHRTAILIVVAAIVLAASPAPAVAKPPKALIHAHAHNDYYHKRPLLDALERGFASIEADVFLKDGKLFVGHYAHELRPERSLEALYLEPLRKHVEANTGGVFDGDERLTLLVDFKSDGPASYAVLAKVLANYGGVFSEMKDGKFVPHAVDIVITGNRPLAQIAADPARRVAIDGRFADLRGDVPKDLIPLVSENWSDHFSWRGQRPMPPDERQRLRELVAKTHEGGRRLRFWGAPDNVALWAEQLEAGVDLLNADDLDGLQKFLLQQPKR